MIQKYRAFHKAEKKMYEVALIDFENKEVHFTEMDSYGEHNLWAHFDDVILMQSIGKSDINNKEIFGGDIIENEEQIAVVKKDFCFGLDWAIKSKKSGWYCTCEDAFENCKVIGNKWENPELLEVKA